MSEVEVINDELYTKLNSECRAKLPDAENRSPEVSGIRTRLTLIEVAESNREFLGLLEAFAL